MSFYHVSTYIFALYNGPKQGLTGSGFLLLDGTGQVCACKKVRLPGRVLRKILMPKKRDLNTKLDGWNTLQIVTILYEY